MNIYDFESYVDSKIIERGYVKEVEVTASNRSQYKGLCEVIKI